MFLSSAIQVLEATPAQVTVSIPPDRTATFIFVPVCVLLLLGAAAMVAAHKYRAVILVIAACGSLLAAVNSWRNHTEIRLSRPLGTMTIQKSGLWGQNQESYELADVRSAVVDVGADATKRIDFVLASGETVYVGNYEQREGFEAAVVAMNGLLSAQAPPSTRPNQ